MFEIDFLDDAVPKHFRGTDKLVSYGKITIGDFQEKLIIPLDYWSPEQYRAQWLDGVHRLVTGQSQISVLFTEMYDFALSHFAPMGWILYKGSGAVHVRNRWFPRETLPADFDPFNWYDQLGPRKTHTDEGDQISEWSTTIAALAAFRHKLLNGSPATTAAIRSSRPL